MPPKFKIGYVDEQPQQVGIVKRKLQDDFDFVSYDIKKGLPIESLLDQIYESNIDLLLVDYLLKEKGILTYNGDEVVREFLKIKPQFPVLIFTSHEADAFNEVDSPNIIYEKNMMDDAPQKLIDTITKNITAYRKIINDHKAKLNEFVEKSVSKGLNAKEKSEFLQLQVELRNFDKRSNEVPLQLLAPETLDKLSETRKEAEEYLKNLINKKKK